MSDTARTLLQRLLAQADRGGRETLPITERSAKDYFALGGLSDRDSVHAYLTNAEVAGGISLEWGRGAAAQDLLRIRLLDADKLSQWLGVPRSKNHAERINTVLAPLMLEAPEWLRVAYDEAIGNWQLGKLSLRVRAEDTDAAINLFRVALAVSANEQADLDLRRFSVRLLNDSKAIENLLSKLAPLLRRNPEWEQFDDNGGLYRALGLEKFPPPVFIKGPLSIKYSNVDWNIGELRPYIGFSPDRVSDITLNSDIPYLMTIENLASFQRHAREVDDDGIVIYSAGFPSPSLIHVLQMLDQRLPGDCEFFHWGDRDIGGLRIFFYIETSISAHRLSPHLMASKHPDEGQFNEQEKKILELYTNKTGEGAVLARSWLDQEHGPMEQEVLDPISPTERA